MLFNVSGLVQEGIGAARNYDVDASIESEDREPERIAGKVELIRTKDGVLVRAHLSLVEPETCSRCLQPLDETVHIDFEEEFLATHDVRMGEPLKVDHDAFTIDERHLIDLTEAVRQYREVSLVMQPLCRPDCRGLCPDCGQDLNQGDCGHRQGQIDYRWAGLAALKAGMPEGKD
jgi:uncharacterized protein